MTDHEYQGTTPVKVGDKLQVLDFSNQWHEATVTSVLAAQCMVEYEYPTTHEPVKRIGFYLYSDKDRTWKAN